MWKGTNMFSPKQNHHEFDELQEGSFPKNSIGRSSFSSPRSSFIPRTSGSTSRFINEKKDFFAHLNGGTMPGVLQ